MGGFTVYTQSLRIRHRCLFWSRAAWFVVVITFLAVIIPLYMAYRSFGFWKKVGTIEERPRVYYKRDFIAVLEGPNTTIVRSTYATLNSRLNVDQGGITSEHWERDEDQDDRPEMLGFRLRVRLGNEDANITINSVKLVLFFDCHITTFALVGYEGIAYIEYASPLPGASLSTSGQLRVRQRSAIPYLVQDLRYRESVVVDADSSDTMQYDFAEIIRRHAARNMSTYYESGGMVWKTSPMATSPQVFTIEATIHYPVEILFYRPGFWQEVKSAWIQYASILVIFLLLAERLKAYVFQNQILETYQEMPNEVHLVSEKY